MRITLDKLPESYSDQVFNVRKKALNIYYLLLFIYLYAQGIFLVDLLITKMLFFYVIEVFTMTVLIGMVYWIWREGKMDLAILIAGFYGVAASFMILSAPLFLRFYMLLAMVLLVTYLGFTKGYYYVLTAAVVTPLLFYKVMKDASLHWQDYVNVLLTISVITILFYYIKRIFDDEIESSDALRQLQETDVLTQLPNRRSFENNMRGMLQTGKEAHIMLIDIDHFKAINDQFGHHRGDEVLVSFGELLLETADESVYVFRWGGEEFAVLCYETKENSLRIAEEIRHQTEKRQFPVEKSVTVSIGLTNVTALQTSKNEYIIRADKALYEAKANGRNRVKGLFEC